MDLCMYQGGSCWNSHYLSTLSGKQDIWCIFVFNEISNVCRALRAFGGVGGIGRTWVCAEVCKGWRSVNGMSSLVPRSQSQNCWGGIQPLPLQCLKCNASCSRSFVVSVALFLVWKFVVEETWAATSRLPLTSNTMLLLRMFWQPVLR